MPQARHPQVDEEQLVIRTLALGFSNGHRLEAHAHPWHQLVYAARGVMSVTTPVGTWVVPDRRAVWVPAELEHDIEMTGSVQMRTLYLRPGMAPDLPSSCRVVTVSPLLRELIQRAIELMFLDGSVALHRHLADVIVDELSHIPTSPLELPWPTDPRARVVAERVQRNPGDRRELGELALGSGASSRTLERLFSRETGLTFGRWRQQARLLHALRGLANGASVTAVALDAGYANTSAFIAMFKRTLGTTPSRYFAD